MNCHFYSDVVSRFGVAGRRAAKEKHLVINLCVFMNQQCLDFMLGKLERLAGRGTGEIGAWDGTGEIGAWDGTSGDVLKKARNKCWTELRIFEKSSKFLIWRSDHG